MKPAYGEYISRIKKIALETESAETVKLTLQVSLDFMDKSAKSGKPFFLWHHTTRMHVWTRLSPKWEKKSGYGLYADGICCIKCQSVGIEQAPEICYLTIFNDDNNNKELPASYRYVRGDMISVPKRRTRTGAD
jgi:hypothetical protein